MKYEVGQRVRGNTALNVWELGTIIKIQHGHKLPYLVQYDSGVVWSVSDKSITLDTTATLQAENERLKAALGSITDVLNNPINDETDMRVIREIMNESEINHATA